MRACGDARTHVMRKEVQMSKVAKLERQRDELIAEKRKLMETIQALSIMMKQLKQQQEERINLRRYWQQSWYKRVWGAIRGLTL